MTEIENVMNQHSNCCYRLERTGSIEKDRQAIEFPSELNVVRALLSRLVHAILHNHTL